jgi:hypothetical protein
MKVELDITKHAYNKLHKLMQQWPEEDRVTVEQLLEKEINRVETFIEALELENW